ncbi:MAG: glycosyltransferase family 39 protein [Nitrosarchaeum sp.]
MMINTESNAILSRLIKTVDDRLEFFTSHILISIVIICVVSFILRLYFFEPEIPIRQDANAYFEYAMDMSILKNIPHSEHANDGWPMFLSVFFGIFNFSNYQDYTTLQRIVSMVISSLTVIPVYVLCRRFFDRSFSIVGASLFVFEPHIIQNSLLGITEPFYLFLAVSSLALFLSNNQKLFYISFAIAALATIVRAEGISILVILIATFFVNHRNEKRKIVKIFLAISIFSLVFVPIMLIKIQTSSGIESSSLNHIISFSYGSIENPESNGINFSNLLKGVETMVKRLGQSMIPYFAFFVPFGIVLLFKNRNKENNLIIISLLIYSLVAIRMFFVAGDLRMIFFLYPLFIILSVYTIRYIGDNIEFKSIFLIGIMISILLLSWFFLYSNTDYNYEKEVIQFANYVIDNVKVSNNFYPESGVIYAEWASSNLKVPVLSSDVKYTGPQLLDYVKGTNYVYLAQDANSVEEYIKIARDQNLSHLVIDDDEKRPSYFKDVFYHEGNYPYLIKEFDSSKEGYRYYNVKVFKIDYEYFDSKFKSN